MLGLKMRTYIYIRPEDGKCVHVNAAGGFMGKEYEHDDLNWQPPADWPYEIKDMRKPEPEVKAAPPAEKKRPSFF